MSKQNHIVEPEELMAYLDGELPAKQAASTAAHLEHCHECQTLAAELKEVSEMLAGWEVEGSETELGEEVSAALDKREPETLRLKDQAVWRSLLNPRLWPRPVWGLAAVGLVLFVIVTPNLMLHRAPMPAMQGYVQPSQPGSTRRQAAANKQPPGVPAATPAMGPIAGRYDVGGRKTGKVKSEAEIDQSVAGGTLGRMTVEEAEESAADNAAEHNGAMIIRTADLAVTTQQFDKVRPALDEILKRHHGHIGELNVNSPSGAARSLTGTLRIPSNRLDAALADLRGLGRVEKESQGGEEVTQEYIDLQARLANSRHTEQRLIDILRERTGKLSDVLSVEMQISRVRGEIERMEAQRKNMKNQVDFATVTMTVSEEYKAEIKAVPPSTGRQFRNAAVDGYRSVVDGIIAVLLWLLSVGPTLLLWAAILFFPARMVWRRVRRDRRDRA
jgi:anti-sigma factor RsiW